MWMAVVAMLSLLQIYVYIPRKFPVPFALANTFLMANFSLTTPVEWECCILVTFTQVQPELSNETEEVKTVVRVCRSLKVLY